jgi:hypothetical protein
MTENDSLYSMAQNQPTKNPDQRINVSIADENATMKRRILNEIIVLINIISKSDKNKVLKDQLDTIIQSFD